MSKKSSSGRVIRKKWTRHYVFSAYRLLFSFYENNNLEQIVAQTRQCGKTSAKKAPDLR